MRSILEDNDARRVRLHASKLTTGILADAEVAITYEHPTMLVMTPTAARDINLPADVVINRGQFFLVQNAAATTHAITMKNSADATVGVLDATQTAWVFLDPTGVWRSLVASDT